jgi:hypothetical protein
MAWLDPPQDVSLRDGGARRELAAHRFETAPQSVSVVNGDDRTVHYDAGKGDGSRRR